MTLKRLLPAMAIVLLNTFNAQAVNLVPPDFVMGDWSSSGEEPRDYEPNYEFEYACQIQVTDSIERTQSQDEERRDENGITYRLFAIAEFNLKNGETSLDETKLVWWPKRFYSAFRVENTDEQLPFDYSGQEAYLRFDEGPSADEDVVTLGVNAQQRIGGLVLKQWEETAAYRGAEEFATTASFTLKGEDGSPMPEHLVRVICLRQK